MRDKELVMDPGEILTDYRLAKNKGKQIEILADQNCCSRSQIVRLLLDKGEPIPALYAKKLGLEDAPKLQRGTKKRTPEPEQKAEPVKQEAPAEEPGPAKQEEIRDVLLDALTPKEERSWTMSEIKAEAFDVLATLIRSNENEAGVNVIPLGTVALAFGKLIEQLGSGEAGA